MQDNNIGGDPNNNQTGGIKVKSGNVPKSTTDKRGPIYFSESALPNTPPPPPNVGKTSDMGKDMGGGKPGTPDHKGQPVSQGTTPITPPIPNPIITTNVLSGKTLNGFLGFSVPEGKNEFTLVFQGATGTINVEITVPEE